MPKAKLYKNQRMTRPPKSSRNLKKENGRPRGTNKRFPFEQTRLGFMLKYEVPVVYDLIMNMTPPGPFPEPPYLLIKILCAASDDPSLKKPKFFRYLGEYAQKGLYCLRGKKNTPEREAFYSAIRKKKLDRFILQNQQVIEAMRLYRPESG